MAQSQENIRILRISEKLSITLEKCVLDQDRLIESFEGSCC